MRTRSRVLLGLTAMSAGLWLLTPTTAAPPALPKDAYKATAQADIEFLQKKLEAIVAAPNMNKGAMKTIKSAALMLALEAEGTGDMALRDQALAVAEAASKKDWAGAQTAAKGLSSPKATGKAPKGLTKDVLEKQYNFGLEEVMSPFRVSKAGGMNIESDLKGAVKGGTLAGPDATVLGTRTAALAVFTHDFPNDKAASSPANTKKWEQYTKDMADASKALAEEGGKGKVNPTTLKKLEKSCVDCHGSFRDD